jgi:hypothetical protein
MCIYDVFGTTMIPPVRSLRDDAAGFLLTYILNEYSWFYDEISLS